MTKTEKKNQMVRVDHLAEPHPAELFARRCKKCEGKWYSRKKTATLCPSCRTKK